MDHENISDIEDMGPATYTAKIELFGSYDPKKELIIRDPYYVSIGWSMSVSPNAVSISTHIREKCFRKAC